MKGFADDAARASRRRPRASLVTAALCASIATMLFSAGAAPAAITTGPVDAASGFPFSYNDDVQGFALQQCQDDSGFCIETPRPDQSRPISVPDNFTEDGEGFWWVADAEVPNTGKGLARFAKESAFANEDVVAGDQVSFSRIRFRFQGLVAGDTYRVTHPFGVDEIVAEPNPKGGGGLINFTNDVGCITPPCGTFPALDGDPITAFLQWDPSVGAAAPAGYIGNPTVPHKVIGSPHLTNFVRVEHLVPQAPPLLPVAEMVGETDEFLIQGKLAGTPPAPAPHIGLSTTAHDFGRRAVGSPSAPKSVTVTNHGTADLHVDTLELTGLDSADFTLANDTCSGETIAPGAGCSVQVRLAPTKPGELSATLSVPSDSAGSPHGVALTGFGDGVANAGGGGGATTAGGSTTSVITTVVPVIGSPTVGAQVAGATTRALRVSGLSLARRISLTRARTRGVRLSMRLSSETKVVRVALYRERGGRKQGRALVRAIRLPDAAGRYLVVLRSRALLRKLRAGRYRIEVTPGRDIDDRGVTSTAAFTITR